MKLRQTYGTIGVSTKGGNNDMPITSKKQSQAKADWLKENSKMFYVRVMKRTESDLYEYLEGKAASTVFKAALREYIANRPEVEE